MAQSDRRNEKRKKSVLQGFVANLDDTMQVKCTIRDVSRDGCKIISSQIHLLPDDILLIPEGFEKPIASKIIWRQERMAGLVFEHASESTANSHIDELNARAAQESEIDEILDLDGAHQPAGYAERLRNYSPSDL